jgi:hypothetical protein
MHGVWMIGPRNEGPNMLLRHTITALALVLWALPAHGQKPPPTTVIGFDVGGHIYEYDARWSKLAVAGALVEVRGICQSACTLVVARIPRERLCFSDYSSLHFHLARYDDGTPALAATRWMINRYPENIRGWIADKGGLAAMPLRGSYWVLPAEKLWEMGYRKCD